MAGNQLGKTVAGSFEMAMHLTGRYPDWWRGRRFDAPGRYWAAGETRLSTRDTVQKLLVGEPERPEAWGMGAIPGDAILATHRAAGVANAIDAVTVSHEAGGASTLLFKAYEQGRGKWQGDTLSGVWFDQIVPHVRVGNWRQPGGCGFGSQIRPIARAGASLARASPAARRDRTRRRWRRPNVQERSMIRYLKQRIEERSTWAAIGVAVTAGATLSSPYSWMVIAAGVIGVLLPSPGGQEAKP